jgi:hypothetical protein
MYRPTLVLLLICFFVAPLQLNYKNFVQFDAVICILQENYRFIKKNNKNLFKYLNVVLFQRFKKKCSLKKIVSEFFITFFVPKVAYFDN